MNLRTEGRKSKGNFFAKTQDKRTASEDQWSCVAGIADLLLVNVMS